MQVSEGERGVVGRIFFCPFPLTCLCTSVQETKEERNIARGGEGDLCMIEIFHHMKEKRG